jgi:cystathionine beta-lyase/cystathionine gamma-synthase
MARTITITLQAGAGADLGPFNMSVSSGTITPTTATRAELLAGKVFTISSDPAVNVTATSTGTCTNSASVTANPAIVSYFYAVRNANTIVDICQVASNVDAYSNVTTFQVGMTLYSNINLTLTLQGTHVIFDTVVYTMSNGVVGAATGDICPGGAF